VLLNNLGYTAYARCQFEAARRYYEEGLGLARQVGDRRMEAFLLIGLADLARDEERLEEALGAYRAALEIAREVRNAYLTAYGLEGLGRTLRLKGQPRQALAPCGRRRRWRPAWGCRPWPRWPPSPGGWPRWRPGKSWTASPAWPRPWSACRGRSCPPGCGGTS
jgi:hypothetical protein